MLEELALVALVALGEADGAGRLDDEVVVGGTRGQPAVGRALGDDDVVARAVVEGAEHRLEPAAALVHEVQLVGAAVAGEPAGLGAEGGHRHAHVAVPGQPGAAGQLVGAGGEPAEGAQQVVAQGGVGRRHGQGGDGLHLGHLQHPGGGIAVVEDRVGAAEPLGADDLLGEQLAVGGAEGHVPLGGDLTQAVVAGRHTRPR